MSQQRPAADIARMILDGFDDYRAHFREITNGARARFEQAQWQEAQRASAAQARTSAAREAGRGPAASCSAPLGRPPSCQ